MWPRTSESGYAPFTRRTLVQQPSRLDLQPHEPRAGHVSPGPAFALAVQRAKVKKQVSYHTFRHNFGMLLNANGENPKVVQELLRHASLKVTTDVYMQAVGPQKREAQTSLTGSSWIMKKNGGFVEVYCFVGVPDGI